MRRGVSTLQFVGILRQLIKSYIRVLNTYQSVVSAYLWPTGKNFSLLQNIDFEFINIINKAMHMIWSTVYVNQHAIGHGQLLKRWQDASANQVVGIRWQVTVQESAFCIYIKQSHDTFIRQSKYIPLSCNITSEWRVLSCSNIVVNHSAIYRRGIH